MKPALCFAGFLLAASTVACAGTPDRDAAGGAESDISVEALPVNKSFANIAMHLPQDWDVYAEDNTAYVGILAGGPQDVSLRVETHHEGTIDSLAPTECPVEGDPSVAVRSVTTVESGFRPLGDKTADYRRFKVTCIDGRVSEHQAWRLPVSKIAIYEQQPSAATASIVSKMLVSPLKDVTFNNVTFHVGAGWDLYRAGDSGSLGVLAGGPNDVSFSLTGNFTGTADSLAPTSCHVEGGPDIAAKHVNLVESKLAPMGNGTKADYRYWGVECADGRVEGHRAWVLPVSKIAIYENVENPTNSEVVLNATVSH